MNRAGSSCIPALSAGDDRAVADGECAVAAQQDAVAFHAAAVQAAYAADGDVAIDDEARPVVHQLNVVIAVEDHLYLARQLHAPLNPRVGEVQRAGGLVPGHPFAGVTTDRCAAYRHTRLCPAYSRGDDDHDDGQKMSESVHAIPYLIIYTIWLQSYAFYSRKILNICENALSIFYTFSQKLLTR